MRDLQRRHGRARSIGGSSVNSWSSFARNSHHMFGRPRPCPMGSIRGLANVAGVFSDVTVDDGGDEGVQVSTEVVS